MSDSSSTTATADAHPRTSGSVPWRRRHGGAAKTTTTTTDTTSGIININSGSTSSGDKKDKQGGGGGGGFPSSFWNAAASLSTGVYVKAVLGVTIGLYILNQKHLLPKPISRIVSKALFWPTLPITISKRLGEWTTEIDDTVIMGGAPFDTFVGLPDKLYQEYGVRGVVNFCEEYKGPLAAYKRLGMAHLYLPTADHFEPTVQDLTATVQFINKFRQQKQRVYVHCRAGHGRSAAGVLAYLLAKADDPVKANAQSLNEYLCLLRNVRKSLWKQPNIRQFHEQLKQAAKAGDDINDEPDLEEEDGTK